MSGYNIIAIAFVALLFGLLIGWRVTAWHDDAVRLQAVEQGISDYQKGQEQISKIEKQSVAGKDAETAKTIKLTGELKHGKNLTDCRIDAATLSILHKASIPSAKLP